MPRQHSARCFHVATQFVAGSRQECRGKWTHHAGSGGCGILPCGTTSGHFIQNPPLGFGVCCAVGAHWPSCAVQQQMGIASLICDDVDNWVRAARMESCMARPIEANGMQTNSITHALLTSIISPAGKSRQGICTPVPKPMPCKSSKAENTDAPSSCEQAALPRGLDGISQCLNPAKLAWRGLITRVKQRLPAHLAKYRAAKEAHAQSLGDGAAVSYDSHCT